MKRNCSIAGCEAPHKGRGLCHKHLARFHRTGNPAVDMRPQRKPCSIDGCGKLARTRGWCPMHYTRWLKHGDPLARLPMGPKPGSRRQPVEPRFWAKVDKTETCWLWTAGTAGDGYGKFSPEHGQMIYAHRYAYELLVGPIPQGLTIDHVKANGCTSKLCVKAIADEHGPAHLEVVTYSENLRRARSPYCPKGHDREGRSHCRTCKRDKARTRRQRKKLGYSWDVASAVAGIPDPFKALAVPG